MLMCILSRQSRADQPPCVTCILAAVRQRYFLLSVTERPGPQPHNIASIFTHAEMTTLARAGRWPLNDRDLAQVTARQLAVSQHYPVSEPALVLIQQH
jgi:hypothetical protein